MRKDKRPAKVGIKLGTSEQGKTEVLNNYMKKHLEMMKKNGERLYSDIMETIVCG